MSQVSPTVERPVAEFHSSVWEDYFLDSAYSPVEIQEEKSHELHEKQELNKMKADVRDMLVDDVRVCNKLELIDQIQRLGISYHFKEEIEQILKQIYLEYTHGGGGGGGQDDLHATSLLFRLLRQQGYNISCDIFDKFKNSKGNWNELVIEGEVQALLSLYEASHMRIHGEDILDEALIFTVTHLQSFLEDKGKILEPSIAAEVSLALKWCLRKGIPRLNAWYYIQIFQHEASRCSKLVLGFAKLDFNVLQKQHQKELHIITRWWNDLEVKKNFPFARDRVTESYVWILGVYFETQHSLARYMVAKLFGLLSILDDIYDAYGTIEELELLTDAINEWDIRAMKKLPEYLQVYFNSFLDTHEEIERKLVDQGRSYRFFYLKEVVKIQATAYLKEAQWCHQKYTPTTEEYMAVGLKTSGYDWLTVTSHLGMGDVASKDVFDWLFADPKIMKASNLLARLMNDVASHKVLSAHVYGMGGSTLKIGGQNVSLVCPCESIQVPNVLRQKYKDKIKKHVSLKFEQKRGHVSSSIQCYMKQHDFTDKEAIAAVRKEIDDAWKDMNEECLNPIAAPVPTVTIILNLSRVLEVVYHNEKDAYSNSKAEMMDYVKRLLVNPIST